MEYNMLSVKKKFPIQLILNRFAISEQGMWRFHVLSHGIICCSGTFSSLSSIIIEQTQNTRWAFDEDGSFN